MFLVACGAMEPETDLEKLHAKLDSLKGVRTQLNENILALETEIEVLDTTIKGKLITTYQAEETEFKHFFEVFGNVASDKAAILYAETPGVVRQILVEEGQQVSKGQRMVSLDTELIDRNIDELETQLDLATTLFNKQSKLWEQNVGSELQYLEAKNRKESLEKSIATLREQRSMSTVTAPFSGIVDKIYPKVGEMASGQSPIIRIVNLGQVYIEAEISENYINTIKKGDKVTVIANRKDTVYSEIDQLGSFINPINRTFSIRVNLEEGLQSVRPNSLVILKINDYTDNEAVVVPSAMIMQDGRGEDYLFTVSQDENGFDIATKQPIKTGHSYEGITVVEDGLSSGAIIVDKGSRGVRDGDRVEKTTL